MDTLRFMTCGSVDDGKSTLIGRLLFDSAAVLDDQFESLQADSRKWGTQGERLDLALLVDGLQAEREQGITIDVAYRYLSTPQRDFVIADTPGHEQYTRNTATAASTAELALILIDARKGVLTQTRLHSRIAGLLGVRHLVLVITKMDLVGYDETIFRATVQEYEKFTGGLGFASIHAIPVSGLEGDNVLHASTHMPWYDGPSLLKYLQTVDVTSDRVDAPMRMPVQFVSRPNHDFRGFAGRLAAGSVRPGDALRVMPSGVKTKVKNVYRSFAAATQGQSGDSLMLTLESEVDVSRGDVLVAESSVPEVADQFEVILIWMSHEPLFSGRQFLLKLHCKEVSATVTTIKFRLDPDTGAQLAAKELGLNDIATVNLSTSAPIAFEPYAVNRTLGGFILIDKLNFATVGAGMIDFPLRRASNIHWQALQINREARAIQKNQVPQCVWFTGLSGSGKSTIANVLEQELHTQGCHTYLLDGDNVRHGLNRDLGFTEADRVENIRRIAEVARLMVDAGLICIVSFISPFRADRSMARNLFEPERFLEVYVDTSLMECERRDAKGLYAKARRGELRNFTGIDSPYETPESPEVHLQAASQTPQQCAQKILRAMRNTTTNK